MTSVYEIVNSHFLTHISRHSLNTNVGFLIKANKEFIMNFSISILIYGVCQTNHDLFIFFFLCLAHKTPR